MAEPSIYRTSDGEAVLTALYDAAVARLGVPCEDRTVDTRFGRTHLLVTGPAHGPPLLVFHGGNCVNPLTLAWFLPLAEAYRIYAPDTIGQPGRSAPTRPSPHDASYGHWVTDILDGLGLERAAMVGPSYGAGIILRTAAAAPERITAAVLLVPSGVVNSPILPLVFRILIPMLLYRAFPSRERLVRALRAMFTDEPDELWLEAMAAVFGHLRLETRLPGPATREELTGFTAPTLVLAGQHDPLYPGRKVLPRAREIIPNLKAGEQLDGWKHIPPQEGPAVLCGRIRRFLEEDVVG